MTRPLPAVRLVLGVALLMWTGAAGAESNDRTAPEARASGAFDGDDPRVVTTLYPERYEVVAGSRVRVGVHFAMDEHWHVYWRNPGQAAYSTDLSWDVPGEVGTTQWPMPETFTSADGFITTYGYGDEVLLWSWWDVPDDLSGTTALSVTVDYLACRVDCIPGLATLIQPIEVIGADDAVPDADDPAGVGANANPSDPIPHDARSELFDHWAARVPISPETLGWSTGLELDVSAVAPASEFRAALELVACSGPGDACPRLDPATVRFVPDRTPQITLSAEPAAAHPSAWDGVVVRIAGRASPDAPAGDVTLGGVLSVTGGDGVTRFVELSGPLPRASSDDEVVAVASGLLDARLGESPADGSGRSTAGADDSRDADANTALPSLTWWQALLLALAGGALLNLMPCVLPVLALKVAGFASTAREGRAERARHAAAWTAGVVGTMLALGGLVVALRAAGASVGWGFQFQQPAFVLGIACVVVLFASSLFGAWHVTLSAARLDAAARAAHGPGRSALEGVLAVVLATPCSAPLLGTAVGFALAAPASAVLAVFGCIGIGLAAPFALVSLVPGAERLVPRPGAWMEHLRTLLGFALLATACWLLWLFGRVTSTDAMALAAAWLLLAALGSWLFGLAQRRSTPLAVATAVATLATLGLSGHALIGAADTPADDPTGASATADWSPWSHEAVQAALSEGRPVFVDFTADWCITCKVNERAVLSDPRFIETARELDAVLLLADWTRRDDRIRAELARYGKGGVPMYLVHSPASPDRAAVLPELLTVDIATSAVREAASLPTTPENP